VSTGICELMPVIDLEHPADEENVIVSLVACGITCAKTGEKKIKVKTNAMENLFNIFRPNSKLLQH